MSRGLDGSPPPATSSPCGWLVSLPECSSPPQMSHNSGISNSWSLCCKPDLISTVTSHSFPPSQTVMQKPVSSGSQKLWRENQCSSLLRAFQASKADTARTTLPSLAASLERNWPYLSHTSSNLFTPLLSRSSQCLGRSCTVWKCNWVGWLVVLISMKWQP